MSQYINGVVQYIPAIQPYQPDFNFFNQVMQTKNAQYEAGYNKISNLYGELLDSPMLRSSNIETRAKFFNDISKQITKMSGLDLSKTENVEQAYKVFQPLVNNKYILKDMAYTKQSYNELRRAESFRNCTDEKKCGGKYWEGGVRAVQYQMKDFADSTDDESLSYSAPKFTPYINIQKEAMEWAKDMGFNPKYVSKEGGYIITTRGGERMMPDLASAFLSVFGNDQRVVDFYNTQGYLKRKDFAYANAGNFGGDINAAESHYIDTMSKMISAEADNQIKQSETVKEQARAKQTVVENYVKNIGIDPENEDDQKVVGAYKQSISDQLVAQASIQHHTKTQEAANPSTLKGADIMTKRNRIDNSVAGALLTADLMGAASSYANLIKEVDVDVDQYALEAVKHKNQKDLAILNANLDYQLAVLKDALEDDDSTSSKKSKSPEDDGSLWSSSEVTAVAPGAGSAAKYGDQYYKKTQEDLAYLENKENELINNAVSPFIASLDAIIQSDANTVPVVKDGRPGTLPLDFSLKQYAIGLKQQLLGKKPEARTGLSQRLSQSRPGGLADTVYQNTEAPLMLRGVNKKLTDSPQFNDPKSPYSARNVLNTLNTIMKDDPVAAMLFSSVPGSKEKTVTAIALENANQAAKVTDAQKEIAFNYSLRVNDALRSAISPEELDGDYNPTAAKEAFATYIKPDRTINNERDFAMTYAKTAMSEYKSSSNRKMSPVHEHSVFDLLVEQGKDLYKDYSKEYIKTFNQDKSAVQVPLDPSMKYYAGNGIGSNNSVMMTVSGANRNSEGSVAFYNFFQDFDKAKRDPILHDQLAVFEGDISGFTGQDKSDIIGNINEAPLNILNTLVSNMRLGKKDFNFTQIVHPIVLNDPDLMGFTFEVDPNFISANQGTKNKPGLTSGMTGNTISVVIPKKAMSSSNPIIQNLQRGIYDSVMDAYGEVEINAFEDMGGKVKILPEPLTGGFQYIGNRNFIDENGKKQSMLVSGVSAPGVTAQTVADGLINYYTTASDEFLKSRSNFAQQNPNVIKDINQFK